MKRYLIEVLTDNEEDLFMALASIMPSSKKFVVSELPVESVLETRKKAKEKVASKRRPYNRATKQELAKRREAVLGLLNTGLTPTEIANRMNLDPRVVTNDKAALVKAGRFVNGVTSPNEGEGHVQDQAY